MLGWTVWRCIWARRRNFRRSREQLEARNLARFRRFVAFVAARSPYYARIVEERGIDAAQARPEDFPVLTKSDLIEHFDEIVTDPRVRKARIAGFLGHSRDPRDLFEGKFHVVHTAGTSGQLGYAVYTRREWLRGVSQFERIVRIGWRKRIAFVGATGGHFAGVSLATAPATRLTPLAYRSRAFDINQPVLDLVAGLNAYAPRVVVAYARALRVLAEAQERGELRIAPRVLISGGEILLERDRAFVERVFKVPVRNTYATSEHLYMGFDLPFDRGMYLLEDDLIFELREDGVCVTNLFNHTQPLIRHRLDDILTPAPARGPRNGPYRVVEEIVGRNDFMPVFLNEDGQEDFIHPIVLVEFYAPHLEKFQMRLLDRGAFVFRAVLEQGLEPRRRSAVLRDIADRLRGLLRAKRMGNVRFEVQPVEAIEDGAAKFRLVVPPGS
ncbi:MAG: phenylacetate--CoA ligase family protein [Planctomycetota bacterium]|jgi:phenylacetate-coenzyme A ligase PaaK-like adenylate-forming protein